MAKTILAPSLSERVYTGTHGNESVAEGVFTVNAAEADSVIHLLSLPVGIRINSLQLVSTGGLGTATVSIKSGEHASITAKLFLQNLPDMCQWSRTPHSVTGSWLLSPLRLPLQPAP